jgi:hypothetical protein
MNISRESSDIPISADHEIRVQVGDICCSLVCPDEVVLARLQKLYRDFASCQPADVSYKVQVVEHLNSAEIQAALPQAEFIHEGDRFRTTNLTLIGEHNLAAGTISVTLERLLLNPDFELNQLNLAACLAYYTGCKLKHNGRPPAMLIHGCGILRHERALLFAGPSGTGKTTIARLCGDQYGQVLNDEAVLLYRPQDNGRLMMEGVPIIGGFGKRLNAAAPLACVLLLKQSKRTAVRRLNRTEAYIRFMRQVITPAYVGQTNRRAIYSLITEFTDEVTRAIPFYELEFTLEKEPLWQAVAEAQESLEKGAIRDGTAHNES